MEEMLPLFDLPTTRPRPAKTTPTPTAGRPETSTPRPVATPPESPDAPAAGTSTRWMLPPAHPDAAVRRLAEAVTETWHGHHISGRIELPLSALAAFAWLGPDAQHAHTVTEDLLGWDTEQTLAFIRSQWRTFGTLRPDLVNPASPFLLAWLGEQPLTPKEEKAVHGVVQAALRADLYALTQPDIRYYVDLFGVTLTLLKAGGANKAGAAYYSPGSVTDLLVRLLGKVDNDSVHEPACGTGGFLRALAAHMREQGRDPHTVKWAAVDIDELAIACLSVNVIIWDLGYQVLLGVADVLVEDWVPKARAMRAETIAIAQETRRARALLDVIRALETPTPDPEAATSGAPASPTTKESSL
ncbi:N-6 DNA methylase [Nocardiopsis synnemataformans]|uniref:N-6 DNA methylase n=1 Tax=Nocardiopsis synnemataformans TaxID=61305 RepID=UPI003EB78958